MTAESPDPTPMVPQVLTLVTGHGPEHIEQIMGDGPRRGVVVLIEDTHDHRWRIEVMNALAQRGYESVAVSPHIAHGEWVTIAEHIAECGWSPEQTGALGVGFGGGVALWLAGEYEFAAALSLSADLQCVGRRVKPLRTPWLGLFGDLDGLASVRETDELARQLREVGEVASHVIRYPDVGGEFYRPSSNGLGDAASVDAWQRIFAWLDDQIPSGTNQ